MFETSVIEISESALRSNLDYIRGYLGDTRLSCVVKGNAYGHGIEVLVPMLLRADVDHISVFSADEALRVRRAALEIGSDPTVIIMGMLNAEQVDWAVQEGVEFFVFDLARLDQASTAAERHGKPARIHIELETGMNRTGFTRADLPAAAERINAHPERFHVEGLCTHFAGAESIANHLRIRTQLKAFANGERWLQRRGIEAKVRHVACSAASIRYPASRMDLVRVGILQYGFWPSREILVSSISKLPQPLDPLKRVLKWRSEVMSTKRVRHGEFIGYGTTYLAEQDMDVAAVPVGYSHGFSRALSNQGRVLLHGQRVSVIGMVNMNMLLVDTSQLEGVAPGDEVVLIGDQGELSLTVASFGEWSNQLNYELLTRLPDSIPRVAVN